MDLLRLGRRLRPRRLLPLHQVGALAPPGLCLLLLRHPDHHRVRGLRAEGKGQQGVETQADKMHGGEHIDVIQRI